MDSVEVADFWCEVPEADMFLRLIGDLAVGGPSVTPAASSYDNLRTKRFALQTPEDWMENEAIHINASWKSLKSAYRSIGRFDNPKSFEDRVFVMDFDVFTKEGLVRDKVITPTEVLSKLKEENYPLPYCYSYSGTPGNFHMVWVLSVPIPRQGTMSKWKKIYRYWGADEGFTNSTMRNPIYRSVHPNVAGQSTHWWGEWSDVAPVLYSPEELVPSEVLTSNSYEPSEIKTTYRRDSSNNVNGRASSTSLYRSGMTEPELLEAMSLGTDGTGRWSMLRSWTVRKMYKHYQATGKTMNKNELKRTVEEGNRLLKEPMSDRRLRTIYTYWDKTAQLSYARWKQSAGRQSKSDAASRYFELVDLETVLIREKEGRSLPSHLRNRGKAYQGNKWYGGKPSVKYLTWMSGIKDKESINESTGEVKIVLAYDQVRNTLREGRRKNYTRSDIMDIPTKKDIRDTPLYQLTKTDNSGKVMVNENYNQGKTYALHQQERPGFTARYSIPLRRSSSRSGGESTQGTVLADSTNQWESDQ